PLIIVETVTSSGQEINDEMTTSGSLHGATVVSLVDRRHLASLVGETRAALNLNAVINTAVLQRFSPIAIDAMRLNGSLYALPLTMDVDALYYNLDMVATPAQTLDDLRTEAAS